MSILNLPGKAISKSESEEETSPKSEQHRVKELLGREFRLVQNGLDPDEVEAFLEAVAGSSEAALKRLEHFASIQRLSETMAAMTEESRQIAEHIKEQAKQEAEAEKARLIKEAETEKAQVIEEAKRKAKEMREQTEKSCLASVKSTNSVLLEAKRRAEEMVDQTKLSCLASIEDTDSILLEANTKAREMEEMASQKVKEMLDTSSGVVLQNINNMVDAIYRDLNSEFERFAKELSTSPFKTADILPVAREEEIAPAKEHILELTKIEESEKIQDNALESERADIETEESEQIGDSALKSEFTSIETEESEEILDSALESQPTEVEIEEEKEPVKLAASKEDDSGLYSGEVTLIIPPGVGESWIRQLRQQLNSNPDIHIPSVGGSDTSGNIINLSLEKPIPLTSVLLQMPNVERVIEDRQVENSSEGLARILRHPPRQEQRTTLKITLKVPNNGDSPVD